MLWFRKKNTDIQKIDALHLALKASFENVKRDTQNLYSWLNFLYQKAQQQEHTIRDLQLQLKYVPKTPEEIKNIVDRYYNYEGLLERLNAIKARIEELRQSQDQQSAKSPQAHFSNGAAAKLDSIALRLEKLESQHGQSNMRDKIIRRIAKYSKDYIKTKMFDLIRKYEKVSALQLREIIVEEQGLCSKSSFYRILEELESQDDIETVRDAKEKFYFFKALKKTRD
ncbi:hypothetical protein HYV81_06250 [Candidatus Woesearchaeota archaeon]|nr:hypothetical protein [Candidatus Woesearchaeota archaeon]